MRYKMRFLPLVFLVSMLVMAFPTAPVRAAEVHGFVPSLTRTAGTVTDTKAWWFFDGESWSGTISLGSYDGADLTGGTLTLSFDSKVHKTTLNGLHEGTFSVTDIATTFSGTIRGRMEAGNYVEGRWTQDANTKGFYKGWKVTPEISGTGEEWDIQFYSDGFDEYGYNYGANLFVNEARFFDRDPDVDLGYGYDDDLLIMKWSDNWEPLGDPTANPDQWMGAWVTNHWQGIADEDGDGVEEHYTYFVKIVYMGDTTWHATWDPHPDGGWYIWGYFVVIQEVWNDPSIDITGIYTLASRPALGGY